MADLKKGTDLSVAMIAVALWAALTPAAAQDPVKSEIRQVIDVVYSNALNGRDIKTFLAGWDQGAVVASLSPGGEVSYQPIIDFANAAAKDIPPTQKRGLTYLDPAIDVTGHIGMARVEVVRGEAIRFTGYLPVIKTKTGWKMAGYTFDSHEKSARPEIPAGEADAVKKVVEDTLVRGLRSNNTEQILAGISPGCEISSYDPERDLVTRVKLPLPASKGDGGGMDLTVTSAFMLIGMTGHAAAGKLTISLSPPARPARTDGLLTNEVKSILTMYVALYKLEAGWKIAQITAEPSLEASDSPALTRQQNDLVSRARHESIVSKALGEEMKFLVSLPDGYETSADTYPVLYSLNDSVRSLVEADMALRQPGVPPMIVVAVSQPEGRRPDGLAAWVPGPDSDVAWKYLRFLSEELFPYIAQHFRARDHRTLYGASSAGLFALYALLERPDAFAAYIASSPTVHYFYDYMAGKAASPSRPLPRRPTRLYIVYGDKELPALREGLAKYQPILEALRSKTFSVTIEDLPEEWHIPNGSLAKGLKHIFVGSRRP